MNSHLVVELMLKLKNPLNGSREHWAVKSKRAKAQHAVTTMTLRAAQVQHSLACDPGWWPMDDSCLTVRLTRLYGGRSKLMDDDGCSAAFKHVRDAVAAYFGVDDGDPRIRFETAQAKGTPHTVRIEFGVSA